MKPVNGDRERRKSARRQDLLAAALHFFAAKGFAATRPEEVAARAGVVKGTLYLYFDSKEELFKAVVHGLHLDLVTQGDELLASHTGTSAQLLERLLTNWWACADRSGGWGIMKIVVSDAQMFPELAAFYFKEVVAPTYRLLEQVVEKGIRRKEFRELPVRQVAHTLFAPLFFLAMNKHSLAQCGLHEIDARAYLGVQMQLLLSGLAPSSAATPDQRLPTLSHRVKPASRHIKPC